jgi:uncharacterized membrane protein YkoI
MKKVLAAILAVGAITLAVCAMPPGEKTGKLLKEAKLTLGEAVGKALTEAKEGVAVEAELEEEGGRTVFSINVAQGTKILEVLLDAKDGSVVEKAVENEDQSAAAGAAKITLVRAIETALKKSPGSAVCAKLRMNGGKPEAQIQVFADGKVAVVRIDAASGEILGAAAPGKAEEGEDEEAEEEEKEEEEAEKGSKGKDEARPEDGFTDAFGESDADLGPTGRNPYFILEPGYVLELQGKEDGEEITITITVLDETRKIAGVETRVVTEKETVNGEIKEVTRDYFAISKVTNNVYYFGEDVENYRGGKLASRTGSWLAGEKGARYGLIMPAVPLLGAKYYQEVAPGVAMDRAEIVSLRATFECPAGKFAGVLKVEESNPLEKGKEFKHYARGVGLLQDGALKLVKYGKPGK